MSKKVKVICHMYLSLDGKIVTDLVGYPNHPTSGDIYDQITFSSANAWACGRATFQYLSVTDVDLKNYEPYQGELVDKFIQDDLYCLAFDRKGKLFFQDIYNDYGSHKSRLVSILTKQVDRRFITYLNRIGVSYLFCGEDDLDIPLFLEKISQLGIETLMLCGGANINAEFMKKDLIDEISLVVASGVQGGRNEITFIGSDDVREFPKYFKIKDVQVLADDTLYLGYIK